MPRKPRIFLPGYPQHLVIRGHNRQSILTRRSDFKHFYTYLCDAASRYEAHVHAWVLMNSHLHLLVTPENERTLPGMMQSLGRRYAGYFNKRYRRSGALWEGCYKTTVVDTDCYFLTCQRYIELNPVRADIVSLPEEYLWSSYHCHALGMNDGLTHPHELYLELGCTDVDRQQNYRELFSAELSQRELNLIRRGTERGIGIGSPAFLDFVRG